MREDQRVESLVPVLPGALPELRSGEVQVFRLWIGKESEQKARAMNVLSPEECLRAARYRADGARREFVVGRAALRVLLGNALGVRPVEVELWADQHGKPATRSVHFNVTHSCGLIYLALCLDRSVGVDVEWIDPGLEVLELAEPNFTVTETHLLTLVPAGEERVAAFCRMWTQKEAVAKTDGRGLGIALRNIVLPGTLPGLATILGRGEAETDVTRPELPQRNEMYQLCGIETPRGFAGAVSVADADSAIVWRFFSFALECSGVS